MTWTYSYRHTDAADEFVDARLESARTAFLDAQRSLERAREELLRVHLETARLWATRG